MSGPPPAYSTPHTSNPDRRALPDGWITRWDDNYRAWYYVDTRANPPRASWEHPLGTPSSPPSLPSPTTPARGYGPGSGGSPPYPVQGQAYPGQYTPGTSFPGGYQDSRAYPPGYQPPPQGYAGPGSSPVNYGNPGWQAPGWQPQPSSPQGYVAQQPAAVQQQQQQPARSGRHNMGALLGVGAAGLLGGAVLEGAFQHHEHHEEERREEAYDAGLNQGYDQG
ncbi:hypothetical protein BJV74DRAFT_884795 [Russula compacta]|nr:hypothetical protein BJV74DRAFT_884795 [Russula compacta]